MIKFSKTYFQDIHYSRIKPNFILDSLLSFGEFFYKKIINTKNFLYEKNFLKEESVYIKTICVGNLTTGGVGKTPIVANLANKLSKTNKVAIISRGYGAKISNKEPNIIKDFNEIKFEDGKICGDEPYQLAKKMNNNVVVITCANRKKALELAKIKFNCSIAILDDGFSNRKIKKDKTILVIDSKMRFGNNHLLPKGPLREPIEEIKRADEIYIVDKGDENIEKAILWAKKFNKKLSICKMQPSKIYRALTKANIKTTDKNNNAIAFCAIGQPEQFFNFAKQYYNLVDAIAFEDHHKYTRSDIKNLMALARKNRTKVFITTQKDEAKLKNLIENNTKYCFNILELKTEIFEIT